jgi:Fe-S-cluster containining protein
MSFVIHSYLRRVEYEAAADALRHKLRPSSDRTPKPQHCSRCGYCCWLSPPRLTKADLTRAAEHESLTEAEFFARYCVVNEIPPDFDKLAPQIRRANWRYLAGMYLPAVQSYDLDSPCVFLRRGKRCGLNAAKPAECAGFCCWVDGHNGYAKVYEAWTDAELRALGWDGCKEDEW